MSLKKNSKNIYTPDDSFIYMTIKCFIWSIIGLIIGVFINNIIIYLSGKVKIESILIQNTLQILLCAIILSLINKQLNFFGWSWQNHTEGLFFISFFFGVQYKILTNIQNTYIINNDNNNNHNNL